MWWRIQYFPQICILDWYRPVKIRPQSFDNHNQFASHKHPMQNWLVSNMYWSNVQHTHYIKGEPAVCDWFLHSKQSVFSTLSLNTAKNYKCRCIVICCFLSACPISIKALCHKDPDPWSSPSPVFTCGCYGDAWGYHGSVMQQWCHLLSSLEWDIALPCHSQGLGRGSKKEIVSYQSL